MNPPRESHGRLWTAGLWAGVIAAGLGALFTAWDLSSVMASRQAALLVPAAAWTPEQRDRALADVRAHPEVREAAWLSPQQLATETGRLLPPDQWPRILSEEDAWLPWVLEVRWRDPLMSHGSIRTRVTALRLDAQWRFVLWDDDVLMSRRAALVQAAVIGGVMLGVVFVLGLLALSGGPARGRGAMAEGILGFALAASAAGVIGLAAMAEGIYPPPAAWAVAGAAAFILAGVVAPVIQRPKIAPGAEEGPPSGSGAERESAESPVPGAAQTASDPVPHATEVPRHEDE